MSCCSSYAVTSTPALGAELGGDLGHPRGRQRGGRTVRKVTGDGRGPCDGLSPGDTRAHLLGDVVRRDDRQRLQRRLIAALAHEEAPSGEEHALDDDLREVGGGDRGRAVGQLDREGEVLGHGSGEVGGDVAHSRQVDAVGVPDSDGDQGAAIGTGNDEMLTRLPGEAGDREVCGVGAEVAGRLRAVGDGHGECRSLSHGG